MTAFFIDSDCELNYKTLEELGVTNLIYMPYTICGETKPYEFGKNYDAKDFFGKLRAGNIATTSALNPEEYKNYFEPFFAKGEDIFYVSFSDQMSGTFAYMDMAVKELSAKYPGVKFTRYDTKGISMVAGIVVYAAAKKYNECQSVEETCAYLDTLRPISNAVFMADDLQHLRRGGRLSSTSAFIGGLLKIKPIIKQTMNGKLAVAEKVSGKNKAIAVMIDTVVSTVTLVDQYPIVVMNGDDRESADRIIAKLKEALPTATIWDYDIGPVIGAHCGPGALAICYFGGKRPELNV